MKCLKSDFFTKLIIFALSLVITATFCSCSNGEEESGDATDESFVLPEFSQEEVSADDGILSEEEALALIEADKRVTEIFVNQSLYGGDNGSVEYYGLPVESEFVNFKAITALLESTYTSSGGAVEDFLTYPQGLPPALTEKNGRTYVFRHPTERYYDFVNTQTVKITDTELATEKIITASTHRSKKVVFKAVLEDGMWRLEKSIFRLNPFAEVKLTEKLPFSDIGSFGSLSGSVLVIEFFVTDKQTEFTYEEELEYHGRIQTAVDRLADTASEYGKTLTPTYKKAYFAHEAILGLRPLDFDVMFADTGFGTLQAFAEANFDLTQYDNYVFAVCLDKDVESSCELFKNTDQTRFYFGERVIIGNRTTPDEICASMLKLTGAYSFDDELCDEYTEELYRVYYKNDILISGSLADFYISPVTAYACGLTDHLDRYNSIFYFGQ